MCVGSGERLTGLCELLLDERGADFQEFGLGDAAVAHTVDSQQFFDSVASRLDKRKKFRMETVVKA